MVPLLAERFGVAEDGLRLMFGLMYAYPVMLVHNFYLRQKEAKIQHFYFVFTGMLLAFWTFGGTCLVHNLLCVLVNYVTLTFVGRNFSTTCFLFLFQLGYLSIGYISNSTSNYVINWTMPQCVLCLRLIGVAMDCYDGSKPEEELTKQQIVSRLPEVPSLLEMASHVFYPGSYFVGPQFNMEKYRKYILRNIEDGDMTGSVRFGLRRLFLGWIYMGLHLVGGAYVPTEYILSDDYAGLPFWKASVLIFIWVKCTLAKYIGAWLFSEGACIISGLAFDGRKEDGTILWSGGANVKVTKFEYCYSFRMLIESFNINTNAWCMNYVYKRCRFLNNKLLSQVVTLIFLALWHGFHSGYYLCFFNELLVINFENQFFSMVERSPLMRTLNSKPTVNVFFKVVGKLYVCFFVPHCFLPFALLKSAVYIPMLWTTKAPVFLFFGTWPIWKIPVKMILKPEPSGRSRAQKED